MVEPSRVAGEHTVFVSGDDAQAKEQATALLVEMGWPRTSVLDLGDITSARGTEMLLPDLAAALGRARSRGLQLPHPGRLSREDEARPRPHTP